MERKFLEDLNIEKETIEKVMAEYGKSVQSYKEQAPEMESLKTQLTDSQLQLDKANVEIESYKTMDIEGIKNSALEWEKTHNAYVQDTGKKQADLETRLGVANFIIEKDLKFSSEFARKGFVDDFISKEFKYDNGSFLGADDYLKNVQETQPGTFKTEFEQKGSGGFEGNPPPNQGLDINQQLDGIFGIK